MLAIKFKINDTLKVSVHFSTPVSPSQLFETSCFTITLSEMPTSGDLKSGDYLFFFYLPPRIFNDSPPRKIDPAPNRNDLGHYNYDVLHDVHTIKIRMLETVLRIRKIQVLS